MGFINKVSSIFSGNRVARFPYLLRNKKKATSDVEEERFPHDLGAKHLRNLKDLKRWYDDDGSAHGLVEKYVNYAMSGFFLKSKDAKFLEIMNGRLEELNVKKILREWYRRGLYAGTGYLEPVRGEDDKISQLNILDSRYIYIKLKRNSEGILTQEIEKFQQFIDFKTTPEPILLGGEDDIIHFTVNKSSDSPYGSGILAPLTFALQSKTNLTNDMISIIHKKAAAKTMIKVGNEKEGVPEQSDMTAFGQGLESMDNDTEWIVPYFVEGQVLDYGDPGKNFQVPFDIVNTELIFGGEVPEVIMGKGNIAEGLAKEQGHSWRLTITSRREEFEPAMEKLIRLIAIDEGLNPDEVEIEWSFKNPEDKREEIRILNEIIGKPFTSLSSDFLVEVEKRMRELLGFDEMPRDAKKEAERRQPPVPPDKLKRDNPKDEDTEQSIHFSDIGESTEKDLQADMDLTLKEYVGYDYKDTINNVIKFVKSKKFLTRKYQAFRFLPNTAQNEWETFTQIYDLRDNLKSHQVRKLREVLVDGFQSNKRMVDIQQDILKKVKPAPLKFNDGKFTLKSETRANMLARTETVRATNQGLLDQYESDGIERVQWVASPGERTCAFCDSQNGKILSLKEANDNIPAHVSCRCIYLGIESNKR